jgi:prolipoprotein diacylglyceryl transferase
MIENTHGAVLWGVKPILFHIGTIGVSSYSFFVLIAIIAGMVVFRWEEKEPGGLDANAMRILVAALVGGTLGAKLPMWIIHAKAIIASLPDIRPLLSGRTIVGGLIGGTAAVLITKKVFNIRMRKGNQFACGLALGMGIGRIGCFLRGCCYGIPTRLPWGVDFGDGLMRHPTQLYEAAFDMGLFIFLFFLKGRVNEPGKLFKLFLTIYLSFRFVIEWIRVEPVIFIGLTGYQLACILCVIFVNKGSIKTWTGNIIALKGDKGREGKKA